jgi:hypothetical protein
MNAIEIWDRKIELRDFLPLLSGRAQASQWQVTAYDEPGVYPYFEVVECERLWELEESGARFSYEELEVMAQQVLQVIWGCFKAFDQDQLSPWLLLTAVDSTFWSVDTDDLAVRKAVFGRFKDVREKHR